MDLLTENSFERNTFALFFGKALCKNAAIGIANKVSSFVNGVDLRLAKTYCKTWFKTCYSKNLFSGKFEP